MNKYYILILISTLYLIGCEDNVDNFTLPYKEQIYIHSIINAVDTIFSIEIERTLPPLSNTEFPDSNSKVKNASVYLRYKNQNYNLRNDSNSNVYYTNFLKIVEGGTYQIFIEWKGLKATAITTIPYAPKITKIEKKFTKGDDSYWKFNVYYLAYFEPNSEYVYTSGTHYPNGYDSTIIDYWQNNGVFTQKQINLNNNNIFLFDSKTNDTTDYNYPDPLIFSIQANNPYLYQLYLTSDRGQSNSGILGGSSLNVKWNVTGDGIGYFIGRATTSITYP